MKAIIIQHEDSTPPGTTTEWLAQNKIPFQVLRFDEGETAPDLGDIDLVVICGGGMNVDQEAQFPWLREEKKFIRTAIAADKKIVGLCLGAQLLAEALGGTVQRHPQWEAGWQTVQLANQKQLSVFQWHGYSFTLPPKAELLATNEACKYQAYTYGKNIIAFQFHPESTKEWIRECAEHPELPTKAAYVQSREEILRDMGNQEIMQSWYFTQLEALTR